MAIYSDVSSNFEAANEDVIVVTEKAAVENAIGNILEIPKRGVPGNPEVGSVLYQYIGELMDEITFEGMRETILNALRDQEPRIEVQDVSFESYDNLNIVVIYITYSLLTNGQVYIYEKSLEV